MFVFKCSFLVVASVAAFAVTQINLISRKQRPSSNNSENADSSSQQEQIEDKGDKFQESNLEADQLEAEVESERKHELRPYRAEEEDDSIKYEFLVQYDKRENYAEIDMLRNVVNEMEQRRVTLEMKLLELYGLKEQQIDIYRLQDQLKSKEAEILMLNLTFNALEAEREHLLKEINQNLVAEKELETAERRILEMQWKIDADAEQRNGILLKIKEQAFGFQLEERTPSSSMVEEKPKAMEDLELKVMKMRRRNKELQLKKRDLAVKLATAEARITQLSTVTESKLVTDMELEKEKLSLANKNLREKTERLLTKRFNMVEELVYQRWLNTCMRIERQNHQNPQSKPQISRDLSSFPSFSSSTDSDKITETTLNSSSSSSSHGSRGKKLISLVQKIKRWGRSKDDSSLPNNTTTPKPKKGPIRRFSMSMVPSKTSNSKAETFISTPIIKQRGKVEDQNAIAVPRVRRVSFEDMVKKDHQNRPEKHTVLERRNESTTNVALAEKEHEKFGVMDNKIKTPLGFKIEKDEIETQMGFKIEKDEIETELGFKIEKDEIETELGFKIEKDEIETEDLVVGSDVVVAMICGDNRDGNQLVNLIFAVFFFLLVVLLLYFHIARVGIY